MATKKDEAVKAAEEPKEKAPADSTPDAEVKKIDETVPGGRYIVDGKTVNANGEPVK